MNDPAAGGGEDYDAALPGAPTELAPSADETAAHTAWALDDGPEWRPPFWTAGRITAAAVVAAVVATVVVAGLVGYHLRSTALVASSVITTSAPPVTMTTTAPPLVSTTTAPPPPPKTVTVTAEPTTVAQPVVERFPTDAEIAVLDQKLLNSLRRQGWAIWDERGMAIRAHQVCASLSDGMSVPAAVARLSQGENAPGDAQTFVTTVMATYPLCP